MKSFSCYGDRYGFWFRVFGVGLSIVPSSQPLSFSERYGHKKYITVMNYRIRWLGVWK